MSEGVGASTAASGGGRAPGNRRSRPSKPATSCSRSANDSTAAVARKLGTNQVLLSQDLDTSMGDTYWSQYQGQVTGPEGEVINLTDTAPSGDDWNMAAVELLGDGDDD